MATPLPNMAGAVHALLGLPWLRSRRRGASHRLLQPAAAAAAADLPGAQLAAAAPAAAPPAGSLAYVWLSHCAPARGDGLPAALARHELP
eukprot:3878651-Prymnesium_polylepis.1